MSNELKDDTSKTAEITVSPAWCCNFGSITVGSIFLKFHASFCFSTNTIKFGTLKHQKVAKKPNRAKKFIVN